MKLQDILVQKIDEKYGIKEFSRLLNIKIEIAKPADKVYFHNILRYFNTLYLGTVDVENDTLKYKEVTEKTLNIINHYLKSYKCPFLGFVKDLIEFKLTYVSGTRRLTG